MGKFKVGDDELELVETGQKVESYYLLPCTHDCKMAYLTNESYCGTLEEITKFFEENYVNTDDINKEFQVYEIVPKFKFKLEAKVKIID
jgi:hypothetical protein